MVKRIGLVLLVACTIAGCAASPSQSVSAERSRAHVLKLFSPHCGTAESLEAELGADEQLLDAAARDLRLPIGVLDEKAWQRGEGLPGSGFLMAILAGHAAPGISAASVCIDAQPWTPDGLALPIDGLTNALPATLSGAVLIVNACRSAQVDPRGSKVPLSVISASPFTVRTDAMFGSTLPLALLSAANDPNCDGLVTDQELFDSLTLLLRQSPPLSDRPAFPKLRRNATSEIPLPVTPTPTTACRRARGELEVWIEAHRSALGELGEALSIQAELARLPPGRCARLPKADHDYFVIEVADPDEAHRAQGSLEASGLLPLPSEALDHAQRLAEYMIFADIFKVREQCGWLYVRRLKDDALLTTTPVGAPLRVPGRQRIEFAASDKHPVYWRSGVVDDHDLSATPCFSSAGQCFEMPVGVHGKESP